jgi:catechol 2,3-dioxygenase-like lactoylglutathione lyase family enzyme
MYLELAAVVVDDYDEAIAFFVDVLGFQLAEDSPSLTNDGRPKRWVVVRPPGAQTGLLLAQADGPDQQRRAARRTLRADRRLPRRRRQQVGPARTALTVAEAGRTRT